MMRRLLVFWGSAVSVAAAFAILIPILFPFRALGLMSQFERERAWLLTLWVGGVLAILLGLTSVLGGLAGIGVRDVAEAGSTVRAVETHKTRARRWGEDEFHRSFDWWMICTGFLLIAAYFGVWLAIR